MSSQKIKKIFFLTFFFFSFSLSAYALEQINAGLLKNIWYSKTDIYEGDNMKIFVGIYNQSTSTFSGVVSFYIDSKEISKKDFVSKPDSLVDVSGLWVATSTRVSVKAKISDLKILDSSSTSIVSSDILFSPETDNSYLSISKRITLSEVKNNVTEIATNIVKIIDEKANTLSEEILALKKPIEENAPVVKKVTQDESEKKISTSTNFVSKILGQVLGAETEYEDSEEEISTWSKIKNSNISTFLYNKSLDLLSIIIKYWKITSFTLVALFLIFKFLI